MTDAVSHEWTGWRVALTVIVGVVGAALLPPVMGETGRDVIMHAFSGVCHQLPERSAHIGGVPLALCDRCLGIYGGVALGILAFPAMPGMAYRLHRRAGMLLVVALTPLALDWAGPVIGTWPNVPWSRAVTGLLFGAAAGVLVGRAAAHWNRTRPAEAAPDDRADAGP